MQKDLVLKDVKTVYSRVILPLKALLEGEFFNEYIKRGMSRFWNIETEWYRLTEC